MEEEEEYFSYEEETGTGESSSKKRRVRVNRSAAACQLCRSQKMKCEGPEHAPCARCRRANVQCVFGEAQGKARQIIWSKTVEKWEERCMELERTFIEHDDQITKLEADIKRIKETTGFSAPEWGQPPEARSRLIRAAQPSKRLIDLIDHKIVDIERARQLFDIYKRDIEPYFVWIPPILGTLETLREASPLYMGVVCMAAARAAGDYESFKALRRRAVILVPDAVSYRTFGKYRTNRLNSHTVMGLIAFVIHNGFAFEPSFITDAAECIQLSQAGLAVRQARNPRDREQAMQVARAHLTVWFFSVFYGTVMAAPCTMRLCESPELLNWYKELFETSEFATSDWDRQMPIFVDYFALLEEAQLALATFSRLGLKDERRVLIQISGFVDRLQRWKDTWCAPDLSERRSETLNQELIMLYHRGMTFLVHFCYSRNGRAIQNNPVHLHLAKTGVHHALCLISDFTVNDTWYNRLKVSLEYSRFTYGLASSWLVASCLTIPEHIDVHDVQVRLTHLSNRLRLISQHTGDPSRAERYLKALGKCLGLLEDAPIPMEGDEFEDGPEPESLESWQFGGGQPSTAGYGSVFFQATACNGAAPGGVNGSAGSLGGGGAGPSAGAGVAAGPVSPSTPSVKTDNESGSQGIRNAAFMITTHSSLLIKALSMDIGDPQPMM